MQSSDVSLWKTQNPPPLIQLSSILMFRRAHVEVARFACLITEYPYCGIKKFFTLGTGAVLT